MYRLTLYLLTAGPSLRRLPSSADFLKLLPRRSNRASPSPAFLVTAVCWATNRVMVAAFPACRSIYRVDLYHRPSSSFSSCPAGGPSRDRGRRSKGLMARLIRCHPSPRNSFLAFRRRGTSSIPVGRAGSASSPRCLVSSIQSATCWVGGNLAFPALRAGGRACSSSARSSASDMVGTFNRPPISWATLATFRSFHPSARALFPQSASLLRPSSSLGFSPCWTEPMTPRRKPEFPAIVYGAIVGLPLPRPIFHCRRISIPASRNGRCLTGNVFHLRREPRGPASG